MPKQETITYDEIADAVEAARPLNQTAKRHGMNPRHFANYCRDLLANPDKARRTCRPLAVLGFDVDPITGEYRRLKRRKRHAEYETK